jgi:outer membrane protein insertion porin family
MLPVCRIMRRRLIVAALLVAVPLVVMGLAVPGKTQQTSPRKVAQQPSPAPQPSPGPTPAVAPTPAPGPSPSPAPTPAPGPSPSPAPTPTATPQPKVVEVVVRGLEKVPESVVLDSIGTRVGDVAAIIATGWFADANVRVEPLRDGVRVAFVVVENPEVTAIAIEGNTVIPTADLQRALDIPLNQVLNIVRLRDGARRIEKLYEERGYVLARVVDIGIAANGGATLRLRISEGKVESIEYKGLVKTQRYVLERDALVKPGAVFNINDLNKDLQRFFDLGLFDNVQARPRPGSTPETVVVEIEVKEQRTQQARFGLGYSDRTGIVGLLEYSERNWKGRNQQITVRYERGLGERNVPSVTGPAPSNFLFSFRNPRLDDRQTAMEIVLYRTTTLETEYPFGSASPDSRFLLERLGSLIAFTRPVDPATSLTLRLRSERSTITPQPLDPAVAPCDTNPDDPACPKPAPVNFIPGRTVALTLLGLRDTRDNRILPTRGQKIQLAVDFGLPLLGGDFGFGKYSGEYVHYFKVGSGTLVGRTLLGVSHGNLPAQEQFFLGGSSTLRAYPYGRFRGDSVALISAEYRTPLGWLARQLRDFTGIVFVDAGGAPISSTFAYGAGIGISVQTPVGPIRIDYAVGPEGRQTWLTIGAPF